MSKLRAGIIGLGVGESHISGYLLHPDVEVTAVCDFDTEKLKKIKIENKDIYCTTDADEILKDPKIDVVSIASYDNFHFEQIIKGIKHEKHLFVEKPFCLYIDEAHKIKDALQQKPGIKISSNLILRASPRFVDLRSRIINGELGQIYNVEADYEYGRLHKLESGWRGEIPYYSVVLGGGVHVIDLAMWLTGKKIKKVGAFGSKLATQESNFKHIDTVTSIFEFDDGAVGRMCANFPCVSNHFHRVTVWGTKGSFYNDPGDAWFIKDRDANTPAERLSTAYPGVHKGALIPSFIDSIISSKRAIVDIEDIFSTLAVCFAIEEAVKSKNTVDVKYF